MKEQSRYRWFVVEIFFFFTLPHQSDKLVIGSLITQIMDSSGIDEVQMGVVFTGALIVSAILYPLWGYLYDRYARFKLLALTSFICGTTTWISAIAPTHPSFLATRASISVDDSRYAGIYSLISDYFGPSLRGKVYGILQLSQPIGYILGMILATFLSGLFGCRSVFYTTGSLGLILSVVIFFGVKEPERGQSEPEMESLSQITEYHFDKQVALGLFIKRSLLLLFTQRYALVGVLVGEFLPVFILNIPIENQSLFLMFLLLTVIFIPFASLNVISTVYDITLPEVRSTTLAV